MTIDELIDLIRATKQDDFTQLQETLLRNSWSGKSYGIIAQELHYP